MSENLRRTFLWQSAAVAGGLLLPAATLTIAQEKPKKQEDELEVTPNEDLMREHGLLRRVLLIYDESIHRLQTKAKGKPDFDSDIVIETADIVRNFVEDYHETLEQEHVFPRLQNGPLDSLVATLFDQHAVGRTLTDQIKHRAKGALKNHEDALALADAVHKFQHMYRPHAAWEDTVLFPAFKTTLSQHEYDALGEEFEKIETKTFGEEGFEHVLAHVAKIEKKLGIDDLSNYTPKT